jgi:hypothetical protein
MRTFILLIAAMVLASATAQAGEPRSLSTGLTTTLPNGNEQPATPRTEPRADDVLRADTTNPEPHRYNVRPPAVDKPAATTPPATTPPSTAAHDPQPSSDTTSHSGRRRHAHNDDEPRHTSYRGYRGYRGGWSTGRIIATLHRYGIYW